MRRISPQLQQPHGGEKRKKRKKYKESYSCAPGDGGRSTRRPGSGPGRRSRRQPSAPQPGSEEPRGEPACLGGLLLANDQHLYLLIRNAWRCRRLSAPPGGHGHPLPPGDHPVWGISAGPAAGATFSHAPAPGVGGGTKHPPSPSFQNQQHHPDTALMYGALRLRKSCSIRPF